jgi:hypothetical protein
MEISNSWADGEDHIRKPRPRSDDEDDEHKHDSGHRRDLHKMRKDRGYEDTNIVAIEYSIGVMIGTMISVATSVMIGITIAAVLGEIATTTGSSHHGSQSYCLPNS